MPRPANPHPYFNTITRWRMPDGAVVKPHTPGAAKHTEKSTTYYADVGGKTVGLKTTDLAIAWKRLRDLLREQHERDLGVRDRYSDHAKTPLLSHLIEWLRVLAAKGASQRHRDTIEGRLRRLFAAAKWTKLAHISADAAAVALPELTDRQTGKSISVQTRNHYTTHLKGFCSWLVVTGRLRVNPALRLQKGNVSTDRRKLRREPTKAEIAELFHYLESAPILRGMTGPQRALGYRLAMATGYRASELRALTAESFDLAAKTVSLTAAEDKRRKGDLHPLPDWLVVELQEWLSKGGAAWQDFYEHHPGRILRQDLHGARSAWIKAAADNREQKERKDSAFLAYRIESPDGPCFWDFHSLRVFYASELAAMPGMDVKTLMTLLRHSTPQLSLALYAKHRQGNIRAVTNQLKPPEIGVRGQQ